MFSERTINSSLPGVVIQQLLPNTVYLIRIVAENEVGMGKSSDSLRIRTKKEGFPDLKNTVCMFLFRSCPAQG